LVVAVRVKSRSPLAGARSAGLEADRHHQHHRVCCLALGCPAMAPDAPGPDPVLLRHRGHRYSYPVAVGTAAPWSPILGASGLANETNLENPAYLSHRAMRSRALGLRLGW